MTAGRCLCGSVAFTGLGALGDAEVCHCSICRKHGAGPLMTVSFADGVRVDRDESLVWYATSRIAERGFCGRCGTILFWRLIGAAAMSVSAHVLDREPAAIREHVFWDDKPAWYDFADDAPKITRAQMRQRFEAWKKESSS